MRGQAIRRSDCHNVDTRYPITVPICGVHVVPRQPWLSTSPGCAWPNQTRQRLQDVVAAGHYHSGNAAIVAAINRLWEVLREEALDAA